MLPHMRAIQIDASRFSEVSLTTAPGAELLVEATMEGEYQKDLIIEIAEEGNALVLSGAFQPYFEAPNDKLSAHKVIAVTLLVQVPEDLEVLLFGTSAQVKVAGAYRELEIVLNDGPCVLEGTQGKVKVRTQSGNILLRAEKGDLRTQTKYGSVENEGLAVGKNQYDLESKSGNIYVRRAG